MTELGKARKWNKNQSISVKRKNYFWKNCDTYDILRVADFSKFKK
jgi:hypothetical protein